MNNSLWKIIPALLTSARDDFARHLPAGCELTIIATCGDDDYFGYLATIIHTATGFKSTRGGHSPDGAARHALEGFTSEVNSLAGKGGEQ